MHTCPLPGCGAVFKRPYRLAAHILLHQNKKEFKCGFTGCERAYTSNSHLLRHYASVHEPIKNAIFSCPHCLKVYSNRQNLNRHIKVGHMLSVPHRCDECKKNFTKKHELTAHMYIHTGVPGFTCDDCPKSFVTLHEKRRHMRFHKDYRCNDCDGIFNHWSKLQEHRKSVHAGKEYICDHCSRVFKVRQHILHHIKRHSKEKVFYVCELPLCQKFYTTKFNLKHHMETAHGGKTFDCNLCAAKLSTKDKLARHYDTHTIEKKPRKKKMVRKERKDKGIPKISTAAKLAGMKSANECENTSQFDEHFILPCLMDFHRIVNNGGNDLDGFAN